MSSPLLDQVTSVKVKLGAARRGQRHRRRGRRRDRGRRGRAVLAERPGHRRAGARRHPAARGRHDLAAARDDRRRPADGARRLLRPGHRDLERRGRRAGPRVQPDGRGPRRRRPAAPRAGRQRQPRAAHPARPRCAPCSRTSSTASPSRTRSPCAPRSTRPSGSSALASDLLDLARVDAGAAPLAATAGARRWRCSSAAVAEARVDRPRGDVRRPRRPARTSPSRPTPPGCTSWSPTCSTTPRGTARPVGSSGSGRRRHGDRLAARGLRRGPGHPGGRPGPRLRAVRHARPRPRAAAAPASASPSPAGSPTCTAAPSTSSTRSRRAPAPGCASTCLREPPSTRRVTRPAPRSQSMPQPGPQPPHQPRHAAATARRPRVPAGARADGRAVRQLLARGRRARQRPGRAGQPGRRPAGRDRAAVPRPRARDVRGAAGRRRRGARVQRPPPVARSPWPAPALCVAAGGDRDAPRRRLDRRALPAGRRRVSARSGVVNGRTLPAFVAGRRRLAARRAARPAVAGSLGCGRSPGSAAARPRCAPPSGRCSASSSSGCSSPPPTRVFAEWAGAVVPDLTLDTFVLRAFLTVAVGGVVLAAAYLALNPPRVEPAERPGAAGGAPLRVAGAGAARRRRVPGVPRRAGHGRSSAATTTSSAPPG